MSAARGLLQGSFGAAGMRLEKPPLCKLQTLREKIAASSANDPK
jgi:hypothetical protein